jgi:ABC-type uncharacterized transport system fused permease/ATPase subunit
VTELSLSQKYADAFWRLAPIPALVVADVIALTLHPSRPAFVAIAVIAVVGACVEALLWHRLRVRWRQGLHPESVGRLFEPNRRRDALQASILLFVAITVKAWSVAAKFSDALITVVVLVAIFGGAIGFDAFKGRR